MADPAPATADNEGRRREMLRAAAELIDERGFADTRIADVAKRAGTSSALVIYYFGTREHLLTSALHRKQDSFYAAAERQLTAVRALRDRLAMVVGWVCTPPAGTVGFRFELWSQAFRNTDTDCERPQMHAGWRKLIATAVTGTPDTLQHGPDTTTFAVQFAALLDGLWVQLALQDPEIDADMAHEIAMGFAERELLA